ncbi:MAG TPA: cytochrome c, partial [Planctomycetota bacterium]|nr:cytochrome c [Planctomycetota bacterium]
MLLIAFVLAVQVPVRPDPDTLRPGLVVRLRAGGAEVVRVDSKPALAPGVESPHPRLPAGPFEAVWTGLIQILDPEGLVFDADLAGELSVEVGGRTVLQATSDGGRVRGDVRFEPAPGFHPIRVRFRSTPGLPARVQLGWEGAAFSREPLPAFRLRHGIDDVPADARRAERGRELVGAFGCARCHASAFPGVDDPPPGPSLADAAGRIDAGWLRRHLEAPTGRMPRLFPDGPEGERERRQVAAALAGRRAWTPPTGDARKGRLQFLSIGCVACHLVPDMDPDEQADLGRRPFADLAARWTAVRLAAFLSDPHARYPDGRMPALRLEPAQARDLAAYLLSGAPPAPEEPAEAEEGGRERLVSRKCAACHPGLEGPSTYDVPMRAPSAVCAGPRFTLSDADRGAIEAYAAVAAAERHPSPPEARRRLLGRLGCERCHSRDDSRSPPLEEASSTLGGAFLQAVPFLRTPRLSYAHAKFAPEHLKAALRDGVKGDRHDRFTFRMPAFGDRADEIARALAEADGDPWPVPPAETAVAADPTLAPIGPSLIGFEGYACVSCHLWKGQRLSEADPGAVGPELTSVTRRIRRPWFDRW